MSVDPYSDPLFGPLTYEYGWRGKCSYSIYGRQVEVDLVVPCGEGEEIEASQREGFSNFKRWVPSFSHRAETAIFEHYQRLVGELRMQFGALADSMAPIVHNASEMQSIVKPTELLCQQTFGQPKREVGMLFACSWDPGLGLAVRFSNEKLVEVGPQDIIL